MHFYVLLQDHTRLSSYSSPVLNGGYALTLPCNVCSPFLCLSARNAAKPNDGTCGLPLPTALQTTAVLRDVAVDAPSTAVAEVAADGCGAHGLDNGL